MVSNINPIHPVTGIDQPVKVIRDNFTITKIEIEELQARKFDRDGDIMLGILQLAPFSLAGLPNPSLTPGGLVFVTDNAPPVPFYSDGTDWKDLSAGTIAEINDIGDVNVGSPGAPQDGFVLTWDDAAEEFRLEPSAAAGLFNIVEDVTPQLGGELDAQSTYKIVNLVDPTALQDAATKNYVDTEILSMSSIVEIINDLTPQLGGELDAQSFKIVNLAAPTAGGDAANKTYVDSLAAGLDPKESVRLATVGGDLSAFTFANNGGVGDTLTAPGVGFTSVDSITLFDENRVLVKDQTPATQNGIYVASDTGSGGTTVLTRATDQDGTPSNEISAGNFTFVETGSTNDSTGWVVIGDGVITVNVGDINWAKFSDVSGALVNIIDDTTPQLGGDLDVKGQSIVSVSAGDIAITPDTTGSIILDGLSWPQVDGTNGQVLTTDGAGNLSFITNISGLDNIVEDLSPQLGAQLDVNEKGLGDGTNLLLDFVEDGSAVNYIEIENEATGSGPIVRATGADADVDLLLEPKGTGDVIVGLTGPSEIRGATNESLTVGGGDSDATAVGGSTVITSGDGSGAFNSGAIFITPGTGGIGDGDLILNGLTWPIVDGSSGQALTTNGSGTLGFGSVGSMDNIIDDSTPQLGAQLDVNTFGLGDGTNLLLDFVEDASAVNYIEIENEATGLGPIVRATGADADVDLNLSAKGSGSVIASPLDIGSTGTPMVAVFHVVTPPVPLPPIAAGAFFDVGPFAVPVPPPPMSHTIQIGLPSVPDPGIVFNAYIPVGGGFVFIRASNISGAPFAGGPPLIYQVAVTLF